MKAELRRLLASEKKRSLKLEGNLNKVQSMYDAKLTDLKAIRSALATRDEQFKVWRYMMMTVHPQLLFCSAFTAAGNTPTS